MRWGSGWRCAYKNRALWADGETTRVSEHGLRADTVPAAARARPRQHRKYTLLEHTYAVVARVGNVRVAIHADSKATRIEERRAAAWQVDGLRRRWQRPLEHLNRWRLHLGRVHGCECDVEAQSTEYFLRRPQEPMEFLESVLHLARRSRSRKNRAGSDVSP